MEPRVGCARPGCDVERLSVLLSFGSVPYEIVDFTHSEVEMGRFNETTGLWYVREAIGNIAP